jgi:hypothetical protein
VKWHYYQHELALPTAQRLKRRFLTPFSQAAEFLRLLSDVGEIEPTNQAARSGVTHAAKGHLQAHATLGC